MNATIARIFSLCLLALLGACGGGGGGTTDTTTGTTPVATLVSLAVTPAATTISLGTSQQFVATGTYSDGKSAAVTTGITWSLGGSRVATIYTGGKVDGIAIGSDTVTATVGSIKGSTKLTVQGPYVAVAAGGSHTMVRKADGSLSGWGLNRSGQLGDGTTSDKTVLTPVYGTGTTWSTVVLGDFHTIALKDVKTTGGALWGWGFNLFGQLGTGSSNDYKALPTQIGTDKTWTAVSTGRAHTVAVKADGSLWAWGRNVDGQLGDATNLDRFVPTAVGAVKLWTGVSAGSNFSMGRQTSGVIYGWGANDRGQLGNNSTTAWNVPTPINAYWDGKVDATGAPVALSGFTALTISAGGAHVLAIRSNGALYAWGANDMGQLGIASTVNTSYPALVPSPNSAVDWALASAGGAHSIAVMADGTLWAWGSNSDGQLGEGSMSDSAVPIQIGNSKEWIYVSAGKYHTFAIKSDGSLWGWGRNVEGQLGAISNATTVLTPTMYP